MSILDKVKGFFGMAAGAAGAASTGPVTAIAQAVGGVSNAVAAVNTKADHAQILEAGKAEGKLDDVAETEKRIAAGATARDDDKLRADVKNTRYRN